jgi:hypothetical protein
MIFRGVFTCYLSDIVAMKTAKCMERSPAREANSTSTCQEMSPILWNPMFCYSVHKVWPIVPIFSQMNPTHAVP